MTRIQHLGAFLGGLLTLLCAAILLKLGGEGYGVIVAIISVTLFLRGVSALWYYFTMARHMVGGKRILFNGIISLDFGMFALTLDNVPQLYVVLYLIACHLYAGVVDVLRALEAKRLGSKHWKLNLMYGVANIVIAALCVLSLRSPALLVEIYAAGLIYTGCLRIVTAFRKTAIAYIP